MTEAIFQSRFDRRVDRVAFRAVVRRVLDEFGTGKFPLPAIPTARRNRCLAVNAVAYELFGAGGYRLVTDGASIRVLRKQAPDAS